MGISSLGYVGFNVSDIDEWKSFAENFLGLMPGEPAGDLVTYRCDRRAWRIALEQGDKDDISFLGLEAASPEALDKVRANLKAKDIAFKEADAALKAARGVQDLIELVDPAGLKVEVYCGATERFDQPFRSPAGVSGFVTGGQGLGHVVLMSDKMEEVRQFYVDALGFKLSDTIGIDLGPDFNLLIEFYHCNSRHHTLAIAPVPSPKRMQHFMLEVASMDDVGFALDRLEKCGVVLSMTLGKHPNDQMTSFYAKTPSGFDVEFGWGGVAVDDDEWRVVHHEKTSMWGHRPPA